MRVYGDRRGDAVENKLDGVGAEQGEGMTMVREISNADEVIDSRDVLKRIEDLTGLDTRDEDEKEELKALTDLAADAEGYSDDWKDGATLIRDSYFTEYAEELCKDVGDLPKDIPHYIEIN